MKSLFTYAFQLLASLPYRYLDFPPPLLSQLTYQSNLSNPPSQLLSPFPSLPLPPTPRQPMDFWRGAKPNSAAAPTLADVTASCDGSLWRLTAASGD